MAYREVWVKIEIDVFKTAAFRDLNFITQILAWQPIDSVSRACFFVDSADYQDIDNFKALSKLDREYLESQTNDAFQSGKNRHPKYTITEREQRAAREFQLEEAIRFFQMPIFIVLENSLNDSYFIRAIFKHFGYKTEDGKNILLEFLNNDWIQFVNAGGWTNTRNYIDGRLDALSKLADYYDRKPEDYLRCFVLMDSDKQYPGDTGSVAGKENLKTTLEAMKIAVHILEKRAMENYMPDEMMENLIREVRNLHNTTFNGWIASLQTGRWINTYSHLTDEQKDFLGYQKGFPREEETKALRPLSEQRNEIQVLYSTLSSANYDALNEGLSFPNYKTAFPKFFQYNDYVNTTTLQQRGSTEEFEAILQQIYDLL